MTLKRLGALLFMGVALAGCESGPHQCKLITSGDMLILNDWGSPVVRAAINGHPAALVIDTGAFSTIVGQRFVDPLGLHDTGTTVLVHGVGGEDYARVMTIDTLDMGSSKATNVLVAGTGKFGGEVAGLTIVGLFGRDFLGRYDTIVDMPGHLVKLVETEDCETQTPGWTGRIHAVPISHPYNGGQTTTLDIRLNGHSVDALLDTGAASTVVSLEAARAAGVTRAMLEKDPVSIGYGITHDPVKNYRHHFDTLQVGDIVFRDVVLRVGGGLLDTEALLGADILKHYRIWIPRDGSKLFVQHDADIPDPSH
ncbi:retroviral-like aspartic protease family protein [Gluconobacter sp. Dm-62]|uniref:retroviral-like aspartic protease family protein n=1 Tax=Gluconobacter sp. Dm-62 TaxID=2799804 RepID=UPI001B8AB63F|nr:retroviral-like aspartic protease family protein [Gluconobacter sp. Dm-62]MBS1103805.1 retroviral-like aspartic protease family protein [Gluconobacter sp. Dm-62]